MAEWGAISTGDTGLITRADTPEQAFGLLEGYLTQYHLQRPAPKKTPQLARTRS
jgi:hypothetical protein